MKHCEWCKEEIKEPHNNQKVHKKCSKEYHKEQVRKNYRKNAKKISIREKQKTRNFKSLKPKEQLRLMWQRALELLKR